LTQKNEVLQFDCPVLLAGPADVDFALLEKFRHRKFPLIAVDGGANRLLARGIKPDAIIGDMDSLDKSGKLDSGIKLIELSEQESTDFEKSLYTIDAPLFLALGFTGNRLDHTLATLHAMVEYHGSKKIYLLGKKDISFVQSGNFKLAAIPGQALSIFPFGPIRFSSSAGLVFPLNGLELAIGTKIGTSNCANAASVLIEPTPACQNTPYLISLPVDAIDRLI
jgi:thiamine pyrophosphokinase